MVEQTKYDYYYASGWFNEEQENNYKQITSILKDAGIKLFEPRYDAGEMSDGPLTLERAKDMFDKDLKGIDKCNGIFADISFRDTGVLVEIGYAIAKGIPIVLFDNSSRPQMNIMLASSATSCIRNFIELNDWVMGEDVFDLGEGELR